jgi:hypothetical protein
VYSCGQHGYKEVFDAWLPLACGRLVHARSISQPHALVVLWARAPMGLRMVAAACFLEVCGRSGCPQSGASRMRGMSLFVRWSGGSWCWLLFGKWSRVGKVCSLWLMCLLGRGLLRSRPSPKLPPPSGLPCMILPGMIGMSQPMGLRPLASHGAFPRQLKGCVARCAPCPSRRQWT